MQSEVNEDDPHRHFGTSIRKIKADFLKAYPNWPWYARVGFWLYFLGMASLIIGFVAGSFFMDREQAQSLVGYFVFLPFGIMTVGAFMLYDGSGP